MRRVQPQPGQESVWDYPRPPRLERTNRQIQVIFNNELIVDSRGAWRVLETSHPPVYYLPPDDFKPGVFVPAGGTSWCEWKGSAVYFELVVGDLRVPRAAWAYPDPQPAYARIANYIALYAGSMDQVTVEGEIVTPQPGGFYGGWITSDVVGPFKGGPGTQGW